MPIRTLRRSHAAAPAGLSLHRGARGRAPLSSGRNTSMSIVIVPVPRDTQAHRRLFSCFSPRSGTRRDDRIGPSWSVPVTWTEAALRRVNSRKRRRYRPAATLPAGSARAGCEAYGRDLRYRMNSCSLIWPLDPNARTEARSGRGPTAAIAPVPPPSSAPARRRTYRPRDADVRSRRQGRCACLLRRVKASSLWPSKA